MWMTTGADGYTTFSALYPSYYYVDYHGVAPDQTSTVQYEFLGIGNAQNVYSYIRLIIPDDYTNNTTIPPVVDPVNETNRTDITDLVTDSMFLVSVSL